MADAIIPDSIEPIVGRRCWGLAQLLDGALLLCSSAETIWPAEQPLEAECSKRHSAPAKRCSCGIYALAESEPWPYYSFEGSRYPVWGEVLLWGVVIEGDKGYRAQYAYPKALNLAHKDWKFVSPLRASYPGIPVRLRNPFPEVDRGHRN
jgi:hypothetical protein